MGEVGLSALKNADAVKVIPLNPWLFIVLQKKAGGEVYMQMMMFVCAWIVG